MDRPALDLLCDELASEDFDVARAADMSSHGVDAYNKRVRFMDLLVARCCMVDQTKQDKPRAVRELRGTITTMNGTGTNEVRKWALRFCTKLEHLIPKPLPPPRERDIEVSKMLTARIGILADNGATDLRTFCVECSTLFRQCSAWPSAIPLGAAFYRIPEIQSRSSGELPKEEIRLFLETCVQVLKKVSMPIVPRTLGSIFYGMQGLEHSMIPSDLLPILNQHIERMEEEMNGQNVGMTFYGLQKMDASVVSHELLMNLNKRLETMSGNIKNQEVAMAFYGLKSLDSSVVPPELLLNLEKCLQTMTGKIEPQHISMILYGLQSLDASVVPRSLLLTINELLCGMAEKLDGQQIGMSFYGLQKLDSSIVPEELLLSLNRQLQTIDNKMQGQELSMTFYGIKNLDPSVVPPELLMTMTKCVKEMDGEFNGAHICNIVYGLQGLDSSVVPSDFFIILTKRLEHIIGEMNAQQLCMVLYGLQKLDPSVVPREFLMVVTDRIATMVDELNGQDFGMAFYGLQNLDSSVVPRELFVTMTKRLKTMNGKMNMINIGMALYGLQSLDASVIPQEFLLHISECLDSLEGAPNSQALANAVFGLGYSVPSSPAAHAIFEKLLHLSRSLSLNDMELKQIVQGCALANRAVPLEIEEQYQILTKKVDPPNESEKSVGKGIQKCLGGVPITYRQLLQGFEMDIVFEMNGITFNIEVDYRYFHNSNKKTSRARQRDAYLLSQGIVVLRFPFSSSGSTSSLSDAAAAWCQQVVLPYTQN